MKIIFDPSKLAVVDTDNVRPNTWNWKDKATSEYGRVKKGLELWGLRRPIVVRETGTGGFEIIDGEQRWTAFKEAGAKKILVYNEGVVSDALARQLTVAYQQQVPFNEAMLSRFVLQHIREFKEYKLPYSEDEIRDFSRLAEMDMSNIRKEKEQEEEAAKGEEWVSAEEIMGRIGATEVPIPVAKLFVEEIRRLFEMEHLSNKNAFQALEYMSVNSSHIQVGKPEGATAT